MLSANSAVGLGWLYQNIHALRLFANLGHLWLSFGPLFAGGGLVHSEGVELANSRQCGDTLQFDLARGSVVALRKSIFTSRSRCAVSSHLSHSVPCFSSASALAKLLRPL